MIGKIGVRLQKKSIREKPQFAKEKRSISWATAIQRKTATSQVGQAEIMHKEAHGYNSTWRERKKINLSHSCVVLCEKPRWDDDVWSLYLSTCISSNLVRSLEVLHISNKHFESFPFRGYTQIIGTHTQQEYLSKQGGRPPPRRQ